MLKTKEVAEMLGVTSHAVLKWARAKKLPSYKIQGAWRFNKEEIREWLQQQKTS